MLLLEQYRTVGQTLTPISLVIASCLGITSIDTIPIDLSDAKPLTAFIQPATYVPTIPAWADTGGEIYTAAIPELDEAAQIAALENFANRLASAAVPPPQYAVDLLNKNFWDLL